MYKLIANSEIIFRISDNSFIPSDSGNRDYVEYLKWLSEGNTPEPADPPPPEPTPLQKLENAGLSVEELKTLLGLK